MVKTNENKKVKTTKKIDMGRVAVKIISFALAILMVLGFGASLIYYLVK